MADSTPVARLDRSEPPEGCSMGVTATEHGWQDLCIGNGASWSGERADVIAAAWDHKQAREDPPGLEIVQNTVGGRWYWGLAGKCCYIGSAIEKAQARAAACAWYWRRVAVLTRCEVERGVNTETWSIDYWPEALVWSDEQVAGVERWLAEGGELPEVWGTEAKPGGPYLADNGVLYTFNHDDVTCPKCLVVLRG